ncbi:hypothetical protein KSP40_PGU002272 [Platanthera guangdongensis]|uniref:Uncharacterized protein n=1 Tax=Platanthera guangdongensis TaxID=2320717 RepID=A0ABR2LQ03_9ASPA
MLKSRFSPSSSFGLQRVSLHSRRMYSMLIPRASARRPENPNELIDSIETFIFDYDRVVWKGDKLIDGVPETLEMLRYSLAFHILFLS